MNWKSNSRVAAIVLAGMIPMSAVFSEIDSAVAVQDAHDQVGRPSPAILSAFFGLDNKLPFGANVLCLGASGEDGMPVVLTHTVDPESLQAEDFSVVRQSGASSTPMCVTLRPAGDIGEQRTILLIGEFGNADNDPPIKVAIVDDLMSDGVDGPRVNFHGAETPVIPLAAGPALIWAGVVPAQIWSQTGRGTACPADTQQVVRVTWTGGVRLPSGEEPGDTERQLYRVTLTAPDGSLEQTSPAALAELGDSDNNHYLCLGTLVPATAVAFPAGHLVDPNGDLNSESKISILR
jgi:hypothetical protein